MKTSTATQMVEAIRKAPRLALFSHISPDGDCIGSMLGIGLALEKLGKEVYYFNPDPIPRNLSFLPGVENIQSTLPEPFPETLLFVDCTDLQRVNLERAQIPEGTVILNVDHHISNQNFGTINWVDAEASASGEVVYTLLRELGVEPDRNIAANLYTAILTDTGCFQYSNTTAQTHRIAAELFECGIDKAEIHHRILNEKPLAKLELLRRGLNQLHLYLDGQCAVMTLQMQDFKESGAEESLSDGLVDHARTIQGVEVAVLLKEMGEQKVRAGLRSNRWLDVNTIAAQFGGGGHKRAAGCTLNYPLADAEQLLVKAIKEAMEFGRGH